MLQPRPLPAAELLQEPHRIWWSAKYDGCDVSHTHTNMPIHVIVMNSLQVVDTHRCVVFLILLPLLMM